MVVGNATAHPPAASAGAEGRLKLIEACVCITFIMFSVLAVFGSFRRRCHHNLFLYPIRGTYLLSAVFISNLIGQMQSASFRNELFALWGVFLLMVLGSIDSITAFNLQDNDNFDGYILQTFVQSFWVAYMFLSYDHPANFKVGIYILFVFVTLRNEERGQAMESARSLGLVRDTKLISDFMGYEPNLSKNHEVDPACLKGYKYLVSGEECGKVTISPPLYRLNLELAEKVITIDKIWQCGGGLLNSTGDPSCRLKDICLSFALFRLLCRRFAGYPLSECANENIVKTWNFVRYGLISEECDNERAFRVIEVELAFLYDFFYTKYPVIFSLRNLMFRIIQVGILIIGFWYVVDILKYYQTPNGYLAFITVSGHNIDLLVTVLAMIAILFMEMVQTFFIFFSDWLKVQLVCMYVRKPTWHNDKFKESIIKFLCNNRKWLNPWGKKLGQYSLLESFEYKPLKMAWNSASTSGIWLATWFTSTKGKRETFKRKNITESLRIELPAQVKKAIILSLRENGRRLTNGISSLHQHGVGNELSWACKLETQAHVILVWHVATSLCEIALSKAEQANKQKGRGDNFIVATSLSKYCAYLVVFAPRLLPDHPRTTELIFDQVISDEAKDYLKGCMTQMEMFETLLKLGERQRGDTIMERGANLGYMLIKEIEEEEKRWKILSDFWTELMLFVSPSDDVNAHAEYLAKGGEFVTHLWALLSHAGILKRDSDVWGA